MTDQPEPENIAGEPMITADLQSRLAAGAQTLRDNPDAISHARLVELVADWIDAEALMWELTERYVQILNGLQVNGQRACKVSLVETPNGGIATHSETTQHAERIITALTAQEPTA
ncbi:hypothetical protein [Nocardia thailandica]|uniref:hypothetical protein n=1 Tax=Nocardia thailandica TaxID=257275 RepID=UPI0003027AC7|nr:hypothetical protein [Nocardia thailandica]